MTREPHIVGTGHTFDVGPDQQRHLAARSDRIIAENVKARTHLFIATIGYRVDPTKPTGWLDQENLFTPPAVGCLICEQAYRPGLERTRCPGDPSGMYR